ncbi:hypothetical protein BH11PSE2_BH11PSE2_08060 [soil metagenome]
MARPAIAILLTALLALAAGAARAADVRLDASKIDGNTAASCYVLLTVMEEKGESIAQLRSVRAAYESRVGTVLAQSGQAVSPGVATRDMAAQVRATWNSAQAADTANNCWATIDLAFLAAQSKPGFAKALECWGIQANRAPKAPENVFLKHDLQLAYAANGVDPFLMSQVMATFRKQASQIVLSQDKATLAAKYDKCVFELWGPVRKIAYAAPPVDVRDADWITLPYLKQVMVSIQITNATDGKPSVLRQIGAMPTWTVKKDLWDAWGAANNLTASAGLCLVMFPYPGTPVGSAKTVWPYKDLAQFIFVYYGGPLDEDQSYFLAAQIAALETKAPSLRTEMREACRTWIPIQGKEMGKTIYLGED